MFISEALKLEKELPVLGEYLQSLKDSIDMVKDSLELDKDELIEISLNTKPEELQEKIKSQEANSKVVGKHKNKAQKEFEKSLESMIRPYRAKYFEKK